jgi:uncharacterized membrane protein YhaH (DUF805 family)
MNWQQLLFSFSGRINRARFWIGSIPLVIAWIAAIALFNWMFMRAESLVPVYGFGIAAGLMLLWGQLGICIKRLHDRGKSGWWLLIFWALPMAVSHVSEGFTEYSLRIAAAAVIGVIWLWALIELGCLRGTEGPNNYGPDPLPAA